MKPTAIRLFPDPILRQKAESVRQFGQPVASVLRLLSITMRAQTAGIGIAAPQIGIAKGLRLWMSPAGLLGLKGFVLSIRSFWSEKASV